jgi:hypothetical protein
MVNIAEHPDKKKGLLQQSASELLSRVVKILFLSIKVHQTPLFSVVGCSVKGLGG